MPTAGIFLENPIACAIDADTLVPVKLAGPLLNIIALMSSLEILFILRISSIVIKIISLTLLSIFVFYVNTSPSLDKATDNKSPDESSDKIFIE